jgi:small-conductance mechanosensitive channel
MNSLNHILSYIFLGNSLKDYLLAVLVFVSAFSVLKIFKKIIIVKIKQAAKRTSNDVDDLIIKVLDSIGWPFYVLLPLFLSFQFIRMPAWLDNFMSFVVLLAVAFYLVKSVQYVIDYVFNKIATKKQEKDKKFDSSALELIGKILKVILWLVAVILVFQNLGYNVSALVAGLGIGGIAIAFAIQNILTDIFSSFSIYFDRPFQEGDYIVIGDDSGVVKKIGMKSTRVQSLQGEELIISNKELTETRIHNYKKMRERRISFNFGVVYETSNEKLRKIPEIVKSITDKINLVRLDRVHFDKFGDFSLSFEVVYYLNTSDYNKYMDIQQEINFGLKEALEKEKIEFAYPTQTVFLNKA